MNDVARSGAIGGPSINLRLNPGDRIATKIDRLREFASPHEPTEMHAGPGDAAIFQLLITDEFHFDLRGNDVA